MSALVVPGWLLDIASTPFAGDDFKRRQILDKAHEDGWLYEAIARCQSLAVVSDAMSTDSLDIPSVFIRQWLQDDVERANLYRNAVATSVDFLQQQAVQSVMTVDHDDTAIKVAGLQAKTLLDVAKQKTQQIGDVRDDGPSVPFIYVQEMTAPTVIQQIMEKPDAPSLDPDNAGAPLEVSAGFVRANKVALSDGLKATDTSDADVVAENSPVNSRPPPPLVTELDAMRHLGTDDGAAEPDGPDQSLVVWDDDDDHADAERTNTGASTRRNARENETGHNFWPEKPTPDFESLAVDQATRERLKVAPHIQPPTSNPFGLPDPPSVSMEPEDYEPRPLSPPVPESMRPVDGVQYEADGQLFDSEDEAREALGMRDDRHARANSWDPWPDD